MLTAIYVLLAIAGVGLGVATAGVVSLLRRQGSPHENTVDRHDSVDFRTWLTESDHILWHEFDPGESADYTGLRDFLREQLRGTERSELLKDLIEESMRGFDPLRLSPRYGLHETLQISRRLGSSYHRDLVVSYRQEEEQEPSGLFSRLGKGHEEERESVWGREASKRFGNLLQGAQ